MSLQQAYSDPTVDLTRFNQLVKQNELNPAIAEQLYTVLTTCEIVLLCDDSDSMSKPIAEEGTDPFAPKRSTRWGELKKLAASIIDFVTATNPAGLDIYFLNRPGLANVTSSAGLQNVFTTPPAGDTPLVGALGKIYVDKANVTGKNLLIIVITDGEPTDGDPAIGSRRSLYYTLMNKQQNVHISFAECTDNADDMEYLDAWDGQIQNFDNTEDYREELNRIKLVQGQQFKFDFTDYVIKILLATFVRWYFNLDQVKVTQTIAMPVSTTQFQPAQSVPFAQPVQQAYQTTTVVQQVQPQYANVANPAQQQQYVNTNGGTKQKKGCCW
jgi:hypothetical protein